MNRSAYAAFLVAVAGALGTGACASGDDPSLTNPASRAEVTVTMSPETVSAGANTGSDAATHPFAASFNLVVSEWAGVSCNMISQTLVASPNPGGVKVRGAAPSATIPGRASITIPMTMVYQKAPFGGSMTVAITVNVIDVSGNVQSSVGTVRVNQ